MSARAGGLRPVGPRHARGPSPRHLAAITPDGRARWPYTGGCGHAIPGSCRSRGWPSVILVVDASVAVRWFVSVKPDEEHADRALWILEQTVGSAARMIQPPHFIAEVAAVLARLKPAGVQDDLFDLLHLEHQTLATPETYATAVALGIRHQHHVFDTLYHAVALRTPSATLVTSDARYFATARTEGSIALLSEFSVV